MVAISFILFEPAGILALGRHALAFGAEALKSDSEIGGSDVSWIRSPSRGSPSHM